MTPTRWAIAAFWTILIVVGAYYAIYYALLPAPPPPPEQHFLPPSFPGSTAAAPPAEAQVKLTHYVAHITPGSAEFSVDVTVKNIGGKKAAGVQVTVHPYLGTMDTDKTQNGPDENANQMGGDPMRNVLQNLSFPDLDPGQSATQTFTLPLRSDAQPAERDDTAQIVFESAK
jgi:hypothetical protein